MAPDREGGFDFMFATISETVKIALSEMPDFIYSLFTGANKLYALIALVVFILALFVGRSFGKVVRSIYVIFACASGAVGYYQKNFTYLTLMALSLIILLIVRFIFYLVITVRQNRINAKIEAKALAKARKRRGSWKSKQGYSGSAKPIYDPDETTSASKSSDVKADEIDHPEETIANAGRSGYMSRRQVMDAIGKLKDLKDIGILTEEEFNDKKAELYSRLG